MICTALTDGMIYIQRVFFDYLNSGAYIAAEWSENIYGALPDDAVIIEIKKISDNKREFKIYKKGETE